MRICLVTTRHISYNPRVLKEADTFAEAGHDVTVVAVNNHPAQRAEDEHLMSSRKWRLVTVNYRRKGLKEASLWLWSGLRKRVFEKIINPITFKYGVAERAQGREYPELLRLACCYPADLYIAHHAEALGAAYHAAKKYKAYFTFDAEDFHSGELPDGSDSQQKARIAYLEAKYLPRCDYITSSSDGIADALAEKYGIRRPEVILNVFPLEPLPCDVRENQEPGTRNQEPAVKLYWYSQVIGPNRGLEEVIRAAGVISRPCQLHFRGNMLNGFDEVLRRLARESGIEDKLFIHPPAHPDELVALASEYDIGLALETGNCKNRLICVTNKIFLYMLAGLAIVATDTPGQMAIMNEAPDSGLLCRTKDPVSLAKAIDSLISDPVKLAKARKAAREAAERRFNWDIEKEKLIRIVEKLQKCKEE